VQTLLDSFRKSAPPVLFDVKIVITATIKQQHFNGNTVVISVAFKTFEFKNLR
jgi:hypothetical protein